MEVEPLSGSEREDGGDYVKNNFQMRNLCYFACWSVPGLLVKLQQTAHYLYSDLNFPKCIVLCYTTGREETDQIRYGLGCYDFKNQRNIFFWNKDAKIIAKGLKKRK